MRSFLLTLGSVVLTTAVIGNAYYQKKQFYPSVVYLTKSNPSMAIIYLQAFVFVILMGKLMRKVFFGQLRAAEMEHLIERSWYAVTETCLAFTVFRDDFSPKFVALFTLLLFLKCFHWLAEDRVDYMERSPVISYLFHVRVIALLLLLGFLDYAFVAHAYHTTLTKGASVQVVFGFEYAILLSIVANIYVKYFLHTMDLHSENPWENKAVYLLYTELIISFIKVVLYLTFMAIMIKIHTFPLFAIRPMYLSMRAFKKAFNDVIMSRRAIRNMNTLYPDATPEELASADNVCIICREEMVGGGNKRLPCSHIFHTACLRSWFQRQQTCPTCRMDVLRQPTAAAAAAAANNAAAPPPAAGQAAPQAPPNVPGQAFPQWPPGMAGFPLFPPIQQLQQHFIQHQQQHHQQLQQQQQQQQQRGTQNAAGAPRPSASASGPQQQQQQQSQQQQPNATEAGGAAGVAAGAAFVLPPFFPLLMPPPPPIPPEGLEALSAEELSSMEGQEREQIAARIRVLRNIQTLLDAAVLQLQQYSAVVARETASGQQSTQQQRPSSNTTAGASSAASLAPSSVDLSASGSKEGTASAAAMLRQSDDDPNAEVRRRRLQRFSQGATPNGVSSPDAATESNGTGDDSRHPH
ncbi:E3 ubiquitin-protein ligase synoviolin B-like [Rhipicephalus microplus]|uniref:E3 ubiquitin-protein ligase synoviolin B-like n=1 Tax=Rhipicephalus microplus TaxID=6941 RepID=UPI00237688D5